MVWWFNFYALVLFLFGLAAAWVGVFAWDKRAQAGPGPALTLWGATIWSFGYGIGIGVHNLAGRIFWAKTLHLGVALITVGMILFVGYYTGHEHWLTRRNLLLASAIPLLGLILTWTNEWHGLIWSQIHLRIDGSLALLDITFGPYFWVYGAYDLLVWLTSAAVFLRAVFRSSYLERQQARSILAGVLLPGIALSLDLAHFSYFRGLDLLPLSYSLAGLAIAWGLFRYHLFRIVPVARDVVLDKISDGVLVMDQDGRIVDTNPAMLQIIGLPVNQVVGHPVSKMLDGQLDMIGLSFPASDLKSQFTIGSGAQQRYFEVQISPVFGPRKGLAAQVLVFRDITEIKQSGESVREAHERLNATLDALPDLLFEVDCEGVVYDFRAPDPKLHFLPTEDFHGKTMQQLLPADAANVIMYAIGQANENGWSRGAVYSLLSPDGELWFELSITVKGKEHQPGCRFVLLARDITERKRVEDALRENEQRYRELYALMQRQDQEKGLLDQIRMGVARELDVNIVIRNVVDGIAETFGYTLVSIYMRHGDKLLLQHQVGYDQVINEIPITRGVVGKVCRTGIPVHLNNINIEPDFLEAVAGIVSEVCVPLFDRGETVGVLNIEDRQEALTEGDLRLLTALGEHISIAIGRARLYTEIQESEERYRLLFHQSPVGIVHFDAQLRVLDCNSTIAAILRTRREHILGSLLHQVVDRSLIPALSQAIAGETGQFEGYYRVSASSKKIWILMLSRPLFDERGQVRGGIAIFEDITDRKLANDRLKSQLAEIKLLQAELHERSLRDPLTGLYNRRFLQETLPREFARLEQMKHPLGMIMADIDHFKLVNDTYGHDAGDLVLKELRKIIISNIRANDIACRYGGEEFVIVMPDADLQICRERAEEICTQFDALYIPYNNQKIHNTISLGVAAYPLHGRTDEVVLNCADQALYKAKQAGRNRVVVFDDGEISLQPAND